MGIVWIGLNKKGIGIHGTNSPDTIGRSVRSRVRLDDSILVKRLFETRLLTSCQIRMAFFTNPDLLTITIAPVRARKIGNR